MNYEMKGKQTKKKNMHCITWPWVAQEEKQVAQRSEGRGFDPWLLKSTRVSVRLGNVLNPTTLIAVCMCVTEKCYIFRIKI